jgi:hypothetical protein
MFQIDYISQSLSRMVFSKFPAVPVEYRFQNTLLPMAPEIADLAMNRLASSILGLDDHRLSQKLYGDHFREAGVWSLFYT